MQQWLILVVLKLIVNPALLSSSETWVNFGIKSRKKDLSESAQCQQAINGIYFTKT
jgi:hypothetical protein